MPIRPERMALYPGGSIRSPEWLAIRERIRARAGDCCEGCGVKNGARGARNPYTDKWVNFPREREGLAAFPQLGGWVKFAKIITIVCTVAHVDCELVDHSDENLRFWCQRCHNRHDAAHRAANRARR